MYKKRIYLLTNNNLNKNKVIEIYKKKISKIKK